MANIAKKAPPTIEEICRIEGIPVTGITIMGGKPYINVTGLDKKLDNLCKEQNLVKQSIRYEEIQRATEENGWRAAGWGIVELFDREGFLEALKSMATQDACTVKDLRETFTHIYKMRGWASKETLKMASMQLQDNIEHMAERRATSRAKREATGTGLTSTDEMTGIVGNGKPPVESPQRKSDKEVTVCSACRLPLDTPREGQPGDIICKVCNKSIPIRIPADDKPPQDESTETDEEVRDKLSTLLVAMSGNKPDEIPKLVEHYSSFKGKDGPVFRDKMSALSGQWLRTTYGKAKEDFEREDSRDPGEEG